MDLENDDPKLMRDIKKFGLKVKDLGDSGNEGYNEYEISGPQAKIDAANKKLKLMPEQKNLDKVNPKAAKKDFDDRKDKDIDNDGDVDSSDKYLHKRRKAIGKAMQNESPSSSSPPGSTDYMRYIDSLKQKLRSAEGNQNDPNFGDEDYTDNMRDRIKNAIQKNREASRVTSKRESYGISEGVPSASSPPGSMDYQRYIQGLKQKYKELYNNPPESDNDDVMDRYDDQLDNLQNRIDVAVEKDKAASRPSSKRESYGMNEAVGKDIAKKMMGSKTMKSFASKVAKMKSVTKGDLEKMLPDYVAGADIAKLFEAQDGGDFKPHMMYDPKTGQGYEAKTMGDHLRMKKMGYTHTAPKKEAYELGTDEYTNHTKKITPGQFESQGEADWNEISSNIQKKQTSMREALAKVWGMDEGKSPFESFATGDQKMKEKKQKNGKTMTGKPMTKVSVDPDMEEKKNVK